MTIGSFWSCLKTVLRKTAPGKPKIIQPFEQNLKALEVIAPMNTLPDLHDQIIETLRQRLLSHLGLIYPDHDIESLADEVIAVFWPDGPGKITSPDHLPDRSIWSEATSVLITYGDSLKEEGEKPLKTLSAFLEKHLKDVITSVHILPFFPYSSDDGFAVMDYKSVREDLGDWQDICEIGRNFQLMSDLVINHASSKSDWFKGFMNGDETYKDFFYTADPNDNLSAVVRPRPSPLLTTFEGKEGLRHLWCTFGPDQVDLNFKNPEVLLAFIRIMRHYLDNEVRIFRLDAVAFLWKEVGTPSIHLPETHEIIRLLRTLTDFSEEGVLLITETNVPNHENLSYFGNQNEAHLIYNFSLPPLLIHALLTGNEYYLKKWLMELPPTQRGCAYLNFIAGHDGIGLRPVAGILDDHDIQTMIDTIVRFGGAISTRSTGAGSERPYEMNIALYDALKGTIEGEDEFQNLRYIAAHLIMMGLEGVPAFYIHSLLATPNDHEKYNKSGLKRCINRHQYDYAELKKILEAATGNQSYILSALTSVLEIRTRQSAFHPNATQFSLQLPEGIFGFWRQSPNRDQDIFCITNITRERRDLPLHSLNMFVGVKWVDLLSNRIYEDRTEEVVLEPYETLWITNNPGKATTLK